MRNTIPPKKKKLVINLRNREERGLGLDHREGLMLFLGVFDGVLCPLGVTVPYHKYGVSHIHHLLVALEGGSSPVKLVTRTDNVFGN